MTILLGRLLRLFVIGCIFVNVLLYIVRYNNTEKQDGSKSKSHPPHILFILADDLGWNDVGKFKKN